MNLAKVFLFISFTLFMQFAARTAFSLTCSPLSYQFATDTLRAKWGAPFNLMIQAQITAAITRHAIYTDDIDGSVQYTHDEDRFFVYDTYNEYVKFFQLLKTLLSFSHYIFCNLSINTFVLYRIYKTCIYF